MPGHAAILAYHYLPANTSGVQRALRMAKFLPGAGYRATVVTTSEQGTVGGDESGIWTPSPSSSARSVRRSALLERVQRVLPYNDRLPWVPHAMEAARRLHATSPVDVLISTAPPIATHMAAWRLKKLLGVPWVADFRDPIVGNPSRNRAWGKPYDRWIERTVVENADALVMVTDVVAGEWRARHPAHAGKIHVIWNGFDPSEPVPDCAPRGGGPRVLTHAGYLYQQRFPRQLLESLDRLVTAGRLTPSTAQLRLVGEVESFDRTAADPVVARLRESGCLVMDGKLLPRAGAIRLTAESDYLLLIDIVNLTQVGYTVPAKIFDYLRTGRPILSLTDAGSPVDRILAQSGVPVVTIYHQDSAARVDEKVMQLFALESRPVTPSPWFFENFDGRRQMETLARLLDRLIASRA